MYILSLALVLASFMTSPAAAVASSRNTPGSKLKRSAASRRQAKQRGGNARSVEVTYTCSMHHDVHMKSPGECPKCGMDLEAEKPGR
jgi:hypothetical protein